MVVMISSLLFPLVFLSAVLMVLAGSDISAVQIRTKETSETPRVCSSRKFQCKNNECISGNRYCDGLPDCEDRSDEDPNSCAACNLATQFQCLNDDCIDSDKRCNGHFDCAAGEDELHCGCASDKFECKVDGWCILATGICDDYTHCEDGSDESLESCAQFRVKQASKHDNNRDGVQTLRMLIEGLRSLEVARAESKLFADLMQYADKEKTEKKIAMLSGNEAGEKQIWQK